MPTNAVALSHNQPYFSTLQSMPSTGALQQVCTVDKVTVNIINYFSNPFFFTSPLLNMLWLDIVVLLRKISQSW